MSIPLDANLDVGVPDHRAALFLIVGGTLHTVFHKNYYLLLHNKSRRAKLVQAESEMLVARHLWGGRNRKVLVKRYKDSVSRRR